MKPEWTITFPSSILLSNDTIKQFQPELLIPGSLVSRMEDVELPLLKEALAIFSETVCGIK